MTVIVGIEHKGGVIMGADSIACDPGFYQTRDRATRKLFRRGSYLIGYATSFRVGDLLRFDVPLPPPPAGASDDALYEHIVTQVIPGYRGSLKAGGAMMVKDGTECAGNFLLAVSGRLFRVDVDFHVARYAGGYAACGGGEDVANGAMHATEGMKPRVRVLRALAAAAAHCLRVREPFHILSLPR